MRSSCASLEPIAYNHELYTARSNDKKLLTPDFSGRIFERESALILTGKYHWFHRICVNTIFTVSILYYPTVPTQSFNSIVSGYFSISHSTTSRCPWKTALWSKPCPLSSLLMAKFLRFNKASNVSRSPFTTASWILSIFFWKWR